MHYQPRVKNKSGEIYAEGITNAATFESRGIKGAAAYQAEGIERRAAGFASGIETAGVKIAGGIRDAGEIFQQRRLEKAAEAAKWNTSLGRIGALQGLGLLSAQDADALAGINNPDKLAGAMAVIEHDMAQQAQARRQEQTQNAMFERQYTLEQLKRQQDKLDAGQSKVGQTTVVQDPVTGEKTTFVYQNEAQIIPLNKSETAKKPPVTSIKKVPVGPGQFIYTDQTGNIINPDMVTSGDSGMSDAMKAANSAKMARLKGEQGKLAGEAAKGKGKSASTWWPWSESVDEKLKGITAEINSLEGGSAAAASSEPAKQQPSGDYENPDAVAAAVRAGIISREAGLKILRNKFGYQ